MREVVRSDTSGVREVVREVMREVVRKVGREVLREVVREAVREAMREVDRFSHLQNDLEALVQNRKARYTWQEIVPHLPQQTNKKTQIQGKITRMPPCSGVASRCRQPGFGQHANFHRGRWQVLCINLTECAVHGHQTKTEQHSESMRHSRTRAARRMMSSMQRSRL